jgi:fructokinase
MDVFGGIEAGGTKFVCGIGNGPGDLETTEFSTGSPEATIDRAVAWFRGHTGARLLSLGIASFGPVDLNAGSPTFGYITSTPKPLWRNFNISGAIRDALGVPVAIDTDVNAAALAEARWGALKGLADGLYLTVGTGIGGGAIIHGRVLHGMLHPEMGHIRVPHDLAQDPYPGCCPFHGDCLEGLACGPAMEARWGMKAHELGPDHRAWKLEAHYLALALATWVCTLSPGRIVLGGGVMQQPHLFDLIRSDLAQLLNGYIRTREITEGMDRYVVAPGLAGRAGVLGALVLAGQACAQEVALLSEF